MSTWTDRIAGIGFASALLLAGCGDDATSGDGDETGGDEIADGADIGDATAADDDADTTGEPSGPTSIEIVIDDRGIPHIYGQTDADAMYGAGYQLAVMRLYQMDMLKRLLTGRLSEVLGSSLLLQDQQLRIFDLPRHGTDDAEVMRAEDPEMAELISHWVAGINHRIEEVRAGDVAPGFGYTEHDFLPEPWSEDDPYIVLKGVELGLGRTVEFEIALTVLADLFPEPVAAVQPFRPAHSAFGLPPEDRPKGGQDAPLPPPVSTGEPPSPEAVEEAIAGLSRFVDNMPGAGNSNNWAIDGRFTENGRPLLAGDPHLDFALMGGMVPMHINSADAGGTLDVAGFAQPGVPGISLGHNRTVAWTQTTAFGDVMDVWEVAVSGDSVRLGGEMVAGEVRREEFVVRKDGPVGEGIDTALEYLDIEGHGTVIPAQLINVGGALGGGPYLVNWMGYRDQTTRWPLLLNQLESLDVFDEALEAMPELNQSVVAADANGIAYGIGLEVPLRKDVSGAREPTRAMDADDAQTLWTGETLDRSLLPFSRAEERGWIVTANNDPYGFTENGRVDDDPFYYGAFFAPGYRAHRIESEIQRLIDDGPVARGQMMDLQMDTHSVMADNLVPLMAEAWDAAQDDPELAEYLDDPDVAALVELFVAWDRRMDLDSAGALAFEAFLHFAMREVLRDDIGPGYDFAVELQTVFMMKIADNVLRGQYPDGDSVLQAGLHGTMLAAVAETASFLAGEFGEISEDAFEYADRKVVTFDNALGYGMELFAHPVPGGEDTVMVSENISFVETADQWSSSWVSAQRTVIDFAQDGTPRAYAVFPLASDDRPESEAAEQLMTDYIEGNYAKIPFKRGEVDEAAAESLELIRPAQ